MTLSDRPVRTGDATSVTREGQPVLIALSYHRQLKGSVCSRIARASGTVDSTSLVRGNVHTAPRGRTTRYALGLGASSSGLAAPHAFAGRLTLDSGSEGGMTAGASVWRFRSGDPGVQESNPRRDIRPFPVCPSPPTMAVWGLSTGPETSAPPARPPPPPQRRNGANVTKCHPFGRTTSHPPLLDPCHLGAGAPRHSDPFPPVSVRFLRSSASERRRHTRADGAGTVV